MNVLFGMAVGCWGCILLLALKDTVDERPSEFPAWFPSFVMWVGRGYLGGLPLAALTLWLLRVLK